MTTRDDAAAGDSPKWRRGMFGSSHHIHASEWTQRHWSSRALHRVGDAVAHAAFGMLAAALVICWAILGIVSGFPSWWQTVLYSVTGSVTFVMVFVIQHTQQRQVAATQRKLDELLRSSEEADSTLIAVEEAPDDALEDLARFHVAQREQAQATNGSDAKPCSALDAAEQLASSAAES